MYAPKMNSTPNRLLHAACELFALHGYRRATTQMICSQAVANIAAVNYHFGGKERIYLAAWEYVSQMASQRIIDILETQEMSAEDKLRLHIRQRVQNAMSEGEASWFNRLIYWEMSHPTQVHEIIQEKYLMNIQHLFQELIHGYLGDDVDDYTTRLASFCLNSPLIHISEILRTSGSKARMRDHLTHDPEALIDTLQAFALAGLDGVRSPQKVEA